ncbi:maturation protein [ssRNA phage SRR7976326_5]|uniref:Maturation protein n=1 Tax=ssRNA phage SRR7976326_5 TaxID=2786729 RepID=A0A8S5L0U7_9VIRU|nr:maturation protein [ssRNA phage SRR7976326_5]DAD51216.1 TPA_asm: maturation protein [ssRNA phage SRR7976326_5]
MSVRYRHREDRPINGSARAWWDGHSVYPRTFMSHQQRTSDDTSARLHGFFLSEESTIEGGTISGPSGLGDYVTYFDNFVADDIAWGKHFQHSGYDYPPGWEILGAKLAADTNPSNPAVDVPSFLGELRELPDLVHKFGLKWLNGGPDLWRTVFHFGKDVADANLRYQFGIKPLISDISKLVQFSGEANKRFQMLENMRNNGSSCYKRTLWKSNRSVSQWVMPQTSGGLFWAQFNGTTKNSVDGYAIWSVEKEYYQNIAPADMRRLAMQSAYGLAISPDLAASAWNLLPWSWLVDWFSNIGDLIDADRNNAHCSLSIARLMHKIESNWTISGSQVVGGARMLPAKGKSTYKSRFIAPTSSPAVNLPILTNRQTGILASLFATRVRI